MAQQAPEFLSKFIQERTKPNFTQFINNHIQDVKTASVIVARKSPEQLYEFWSGLFKFEIEKQMKNSQR
ncbi:hypothetical protein BCV72DRAFT_283235 [Rhizopus microsporus var. microsporus]|uniref:Uncharacterized protein n=2 Tax=Rhizopus microsporus TaxID=58291 RepID=A0A2G4SEH0_RHIZD|nr:uncharacterized protein RHIMIDRAFT_283587 [Rhizopus microsporus ATCC 52813]XP_023460899.1 uncharacterized protein RHIMIDRAFT_281879 [Rhizopus microsporus ATCC 52813]ORE00738.1 hypothetical protein BCV72DRAFT_283235 [Rhizopus microsporus var. microsporus]PHZ07183.1 hypothetical protein RHIMIDRAFT_283587 [Rhizopus microsporus ATCC 52813]PHZ07191.1 hypothetical protein RHIMIDRAFT_281879 [Rhizopus microsporus ATCC 52813]